MSVVNRKGRNRMTEPKLRGGYRHPLNVHCSSTCSTCWTEVEITMSTTQIPATQTPMLDVEDRNRRASDNGSHPGHHHPTDRGDPPGGPGGPRRRAADRCSVHRA